MMSITEYKGIHIDEPVCIIANGPSLLSLDLGKVDCLTIGLNRAWELMACDYYVAGDMGQFAHYIRAHGDIVKWRSLFTLDNEHAPRHAVKVRELKPKHRQISMDLCDGVYPNNTVTAFGIQLAMHMGCDPIYIVGLDGKGAHFYGGSEIPDAVWAEQREAFGYIAGASMGWFEIYNLNPDSAIKAFPFARFDAVFPTHQGGGVISQGK